MQDMDVIKKRMAEHIALVEAVTQGDLPARLANVAEKIREALAAGHKVLLCGNGGSAADCQHLAAELVGRFQKERAALPAIALTVDTSILTAIGNDYGFEKVFVRQVEALGQAGDVLLGLSTSGNSLDVLKAAELAKERGLYTVGFTAAGGGRLAELCDVCLAVPVKVTARAQEVHILMGHIICELVEGA